MCLSGTVSRLGKRTSKLKMNERFCGALEQHMKHVPEDARARIFAGRQLRRIGARGRRLARTQLAVTLRANEASILYNAACVYCLLNKRRKLWMPAQSLGSGFKDAVWTRRDPDLVILHGIRSLSASIRKRHDADLPI